MACTFYTLGISLSTSCPCSPADSTTSRPQPSIRSIRPCENDTSLIDASILDAIGERAAPLVLASIARERSQENALTDVTTDLPNERAFHLVLENQVAEAVRKAFRS